MATPQEEAAIRDVGGIEVSRFPAVENELDRVVNDFLPFAGGGWSERSLGYTRSTTAGNRVLVNGPRSQGYTRSTTAGNRVLVNGPRSQGTTRQQAASASIQASRSSSVGFDRSAQGTVGVVATSNTAQGYEREESATVGTQAARSADVGSTRATTAGNRVLVNGPRSHGATRDLKASTAVAALNARSLSFDRGAGATAPIGSTHHKTLGVGHSRSINTRSFYAGQTPRLPYWSFGHDWSRAFTKAYEWRTEVFRSDSGVEQRRSMRTVPRIFLDSFSKLYGPDAAYAQQTVSRAFADRWYVPDESRAVQIENDQNGVLETDAAIPGLRSGDILALSSSPQRFNLVRVLSIESAGVYRLEVPLQGFETVRPVFVGYLSGNLDIERGTDRTANIGAQFQIDSSPVVQPAVEGTYRGIAINEFRHDWRRGAKRSVVGDYATLENPFGRTLRGRTSSRDILQHEVSTVMSETDASAFERWLFARRGRAVPFWDDDLFESAYLRRAQSERVLEIEQIGYTENGGPRTGYQDIRVRWRAGDSTLYRIAASEDFGEWETITLETALHRPAAEIASISFAEVYRLDQDRIELAFSAASPGVCRAALRVVVAPDLRRSPQ